MSVDTGVQRDARVFTKSDIPIKMSLSLRPINSDFHEPPYRTHMSQISVYAAYEKTMVLAVAPNKLSTMS
jgi:hypothetical protein